MKLTGKTAVVTGGTKGIGAELCRLFSQAGANTVCLARSCGEGEKNGIFYIPCDVCDAAAVENAFRAIGEKFGGVDFLINNAGMGISGSVEKTSERDFDSISDVNFKGTYNCIRFGLPLLRQSKGRLVNVSSVAGAIAIPYQAFYSATKAAVLSLSDALRNEVRPFGVKVLAVLPGDVKTCFTESRRKNADEGVYAAYAENSVKVMEKDEQQGMSAAYAAKKIFACAVKRNMPHVKVIGVKYKFLYFAAGILPRRLKDWLLYKIYGGES